MQHEYLKPILGDDLFAQFNEKMAKASGITLVNVADGSFIPKGKFDEEHNKAKEQGQKISELTAKIAGLESSEPTAKLAAQEKQISELTASLAVREQQATEASALKTQIEQLQADIAARDGQLQTQSMTYRIKEHLRGMKVRNAEVVMPLLKLDAIIEKDGNLAGLTEQVEALKKTDGYLFDMQQGARGGFPGGQDLGGSPDVNKSVNDAIRAMSGHAT